MEDFNTYVYFALTGDDFNPQVVTDQIGLVPTIAFRKGDKGNNKTYLEYSRWQLSTDKVKECIFVATLVDQIVSRLLDKIELINNLKSKYTLNSVLEIVLYVDTDELKSTPSLDFDLKIIEFLYRTGTKVDVDIYRCNSINKC